MRFSLQRNEHVGVGDVSLSANLAVDYFKFSFSNILSSL